MVREQTLGVTDILPLLGMHRDTYDALIPDARDAVEDLYYDMTEFDYEEVKRYWADFDIDQINFLVELYSNRIWDDTGCARVRRLA